MSDYDDLSNDYMEESLDSTQDKLDEIHSTLAEIRDSLPSLKPASEFWTFLWAFIVFWLLSNWDGSSIDRWTDKAWHSVWNNANFSDITVNKRPKDCDFTHAPIGDKGCSYEKKAEVFGEAQRKQLLQNATTAGERYEIQNRPNSVLIYWEKKEE
jgi:hypothetical protein